MPVLLTGLEDLAAQHEFALGEPLKIFGNRRELVVSVEDDSNEDIVLIGSDIDLSVAAGIADHFRLRRPSLAVILIRRRVDVQTLNEALRSGLRDVVSVDDAMALLDAVKRSRALAVEVRSATGASTVTATRGRLIVVFSAKGGCGKTTISTNLATAFGKLGVRTCLVDFDLQFGDVAVALQVNPSKTISDALSMERSLDRMGVLGLTIPVGENFDVVLAPNNPTDVELISGDLGETILSRLQEEYDVVVVDSPPAFTEVMIRAFDLADMTLLLTTLDMPAIKNLILSLETLDALGLQNKPRKILVNRSDSRAGLEIQDVEQAVGVPISGKTQSTVDVPASVNRGVTLVDWKPKHVFSRAVTDLARTISEELGIDTNQTTGRFSWRSK